jgi:hypothetical protein
MLVILVLFTVAQTRHQLAVLGAPFESRCEKKTHFQVT